MDLHQKLSIIVELTKLIREKQSSILDIFTQISNIASEVSNSQRSSLFLYEKSSNRLQTKVAQGLDEIITIDLNQGIAGRCAASKESIIENDVYSNAYFDKSVDQKTGYTTQKLLAVPILGQDGALLGVLQVLNKEQGNYNEDDKDLLIIVAELVASVLEDLAFTKRLEEKVDEKTKELKTLNENLKAEVARQVKANREKDALMFAQSKLAAMGELFDAVAHQWKQPLSIMSVYAMELQLLDSDNLQEDTLNELAQKFNAQIEHLNTTLRDFRSFFRNDGSSESFSLLDAVKKVLHLIEGEIKKYALTIDIAIDSDIKLLGKEDEFKHVILNLINNARDAFEERAINERHITLSATYDEKEITLSVEDNAGGIPKAIIDDIFKANVTSKAPGKGTGIGLYMSKMIVEKMRGTIRVQSEAGHTTFILSFPRAKD